MALHSAPDPPFLIRTLQQQFCWQKGLTNWNEYWWRRGQGWNTSIASNCLIKHFHIPHIVALYPKNFDYIVLELVNTAAYNSSKYIPLCVLSENFFQRFRLVWWKSVTLSLVYCRKGAKCFVPMLGWREVKHNGQKWAMHFPL